MKRDLKQLADNEFDVCVIGGGIYGACAAWDAVLRGLSVALVEKYDFGHATSFNSQNTIHGGFRYIQNLDISRVRAAVKERQTWLSIAPHIIHPLPFLIPTYRNRTKSKKLFYLAFRLYDLLSLDQKKLADPQKNIPAGRIVTIRQCKDLFPDMDEQDLTGGALFYDAFIHNPSRLCLSFLRSAQKKGAVIANYAQAIKLLKKNNRLEGVQIQDMITDNVFLLRAKSVVNMSGPWVSQVLTGLNRSNTNSVELLKVMYLIVKRPVPNSAIGLLGRHGKYYFMLPWHNHALVGIAELPHDPRDLEGLQVNENDVESFISEINRARPSINLRREHVVAIRKGLLPANEVKLSSNQLQLSTKAKIIDHSKDGVNNLISVVGIKFTMARMVAQQIIDLVFLKLGYETSHCKTHKTKIHGGNIERFNDFMSQVLAENQHCLSPESIRHLILNYGSSYKEILKYLNHDFESQNKLIDCSNLLKAEILHAVHEEMPQKLSDVVFRRTELGLMGNPGDDILATCADIVAQEMGWDQHFKEKELQHVKDAL